MAGVFMKSGYLDICVTTQLKVDLELNLKNKSFSTFC